MRGLRWLWNLRIRPRTQGRSAAAHDTECDCLLCTPSEDERLLIIISEAVSTIIEEMTVRRLLRANELEMQPDGTTVRRKQYRCQIPFDPAMTQDDAQPTRGIELSLSPSDDSHFVQADLTLIKLVTNDRAGAALPQLQMPAPTLPASVVSLSNTTRLRDIDRALAELDAGIRDALQAPGDMTTSLMAEFTAQRNRLSNERNAMMLLVAPEQPPANATPSAAMQETDNATTTQPLTTMADHMTALEAMITQPDPDAANVNVMTREELINQIAEAVSCLPEEVISIPNGIDLARVLAGVERTVYAWINRGRISEGVRVNLDNPRHPPTTRPMRNIRIRPDRVAAEDCSTTEQ